MKKKILKLFLIMFIFATVLTNTKIFAKEDIVLENNVIYNECYTYEQLKELGQLSNEQDNIQLSRMSNRKTLSNNLTQTIQSEDFTYKPVYNNSTYLYVNSDLENDYVILNNYGENYQLIRHDIKNNTNTTIYTSKDTYEGITTYIRDNIIYIEEAPYKEYSEGDYEEVQVLGFDISTDTVVYEGKFAVPVDQDDYFTSFAVDSKQRFYFVYEYTGTKVFDNKGNLIYDKPSIEKEEGSAQYEIVIHSITPNDEGIIFSLGYYNWPPYAYLKTDHIGFQRLNEDGTFKESSYTLFSNPPYTYYVEDPDWRFIDEEGIYAVNQYGQIGKFDYTAINICGVTIEIIDDTLREVVDANDGHLYNPVYFVKDNYLYLLGSNNNIYVYDIDKNFEKIGRISTGIVEETDYDKVYRITYIEDYIYIKYYKSDVGTQERKISLNSLEKFKDIWYTEQSTQARTKKEIIDKYNATVPKFNYSNNIYLIEPSYEAPYIAGKLNEQVVTDTLNQINYFRWLYGANEVVVNADKLERSQKGAVIQAANNELTHYPSQPLDMDNEFYEEAYAACGASSTSGDSYNGNCAYGDSAPTYSIEGFISDLYNVSIGSYIGHRLNLLDLDVTKTSFGFCNRYTALSMYYGEEDFVSNEKFYAYPAAGNFPMQSFTTNEYWSFQCKENYYIKDLKIEFEYNEKIYEQENFAVERTSIVFKMPDELINELGGTWEKMPQANISVKLTGMKNSNGDTVNFSYDVNFFDINEVLISGIAFANKEQSQFVETTKIAQELNVLPVNTTEKYEIIWSSSNSNVATIDSNGSITAKKVGITVITAKVGEYTASYTLNVEETPEYTLGDINKDGKINARDARLALQYFAGKITFTDEQKVIADVNIDGKINARDARLILQLFAGKIKSF